MAHDGPKARKSPPSGLQDDPRGLHDGPGGLQEGLQEGQKRRKSLMVLRLLKDVGMCVLSVFRRPEAA
eukprot:380334-Pyramimonas_sp.AAC.1